MLCNSSSLTPWPIIINCFRNNKIYARIAKISFWAGRGPSKKRKGKEKIYQFKFNYKVELVNNELLNKTLQLVIAQLSSHHLNLPKYF